MNTRSRSLAWDATTAIEALAAADTALWIWTPADDQMRFTGATRALGLGPLAPECSGAAFTALQRALGDGPVIKKPVTVTVDYMRGGTPQEAAGSIYLLCIPESNYISGQTVVVSGGRP